MTANGYASGDSRKLDKVGGTMTGVLTLVDGSPAASQAYVGSHTVANNTAQTLIAVNGTLTPDASLIGPFSYDATTDIALGAPGGGTNRQVIDVLIYASGGDRTLTVAGGTVLIPSGTEWWGRLIYSQTRDTWTLYASS